MPDPELLLALDVAVDAIVAARTLAGGLPLDALPDEGLEAALLGDAAYQQALLAHRAAYDGVEGIMGPDASDKLIDLADATTSVSHAALRVGWRLGLLVGAGGAS
jgi:hypothetical protein